MRPQTDAPPSKWLTYRPGPTAENMLRCRKRVIAGEGAVGTGKSSIFCQYMGAHIAECPGAIWIVVRRTYRMLRDNTVPTWLQWFPDGSAGRWSEANETFHLDCQFMGRPLKGEVRFRSAERPEDVDKFMGGEYAGAFLEEVTGTYQESGGLKEDVYTGLGMRLRQSGIPWACEQCRRILPANLIPTDPDHEYADCPSCGTPQCVRARYHILLGFNPPAPGHWVDTEFPLPAAETEGSAHFRIPRQENAHNLPPGYYQAIAKQYRLKGDWAKRYLDGERVPIGRATSVFDTDAIYAALTGWVSEPKVRCVLLRDKETGKIAPDTQANGPIRVWKLPKPPDEEQYVMGADSGEGLAEGDPSCAYVMSRLTGEVVAEIHGHFIPRRFARELAMLGWWYNTAFLCPEVEPSAAGRSTCDELENLGYTNLYLQRKEQHIGDPIVKRFGLPMTRTNKSRIVGVAREIVEERQLRTPVRELWLELLNFVRHPVADGRQARMAADVGTKDDRVIAYLCTLEAYFRQGPWKPQPKIGPAPAWMGRLLGSYTGGPVGSQAWMAN